jgi:uncharacterized membrane protein (DUF485 family)
MAKKPLGRSAAKMPASRSSAPEQQYPWAKLEASPQFVQLKKAKFAFVVPAVIFFIVYYLSLPILVGYFPALMGTKVWGGVNLAYLWALSQFLMTWVVAALYMRAARRFDQQAAGVSALAGKGGRG